MRLTQYHPCNLRERFGCQEHRKAFEQNDVKEFNFYDKIFYLTQTKKKVTGTKNDVHFLHSILSGHTSMPLVHFNSYELTQIPVCTFISKDLLQQRFLVLWSTQRVFHRTKDG